MASKLPRITNINHAAGIYADMSVDGPAIGTLVAVIDRAKNLPNRKTMGKQNPYCAARLGKEAKKTETDLRGGQTPKWDHELRFTVHESPDYFRLKVSIFNDDKKTDLIGETWIDLRDLIIPGGSQSDQWHPLQYRGKYAGEVRIEMTYYDTRPEDEAVIERRMQAAEKVHTKSSGSRPAPAAPVSSSSSLSGPRQLEKVKRRPLPSDPTASTPARPGPPEKAPSAPLPSHPAPVRPVHHEHAHSTPALNGADHMRYSQRQAPEAPYDAYASASQPPPPAKVYDTPDDFHREWNHAAPAHPAPPPLRRSPQEESYPYRERPDAYDSRHHARPRSSYGNGPAPDYRSMPPSRPEYQSQPGPDMHPRHPYESTSRPTSHHSNRQFPAPEQYGYEGDALRHGHEVAQYSPHSSTRSYNHSPVDYAPAPAPEPEHHYRLHSNSVASINSRHRNSIAHDNFHPDYAAMQPRVDDEEEEGPPPPPPAHRSGLVQPSQQLVPSPASSYKAYSPEFAPSPRNTNDMTALQPLRPSHGNRLQDHPRMKNPSVPRSLVAGFDPALAEVEAVRAVQESQANRRRSFFEEDALIRTTGSKPASIPYPDDTDYRSSLVLRKSVSSESRIVPRRKSVSPRPPSTAERQVSQTPFSPDSYDALNPNAARSAVTRDTAPAYETVAQAMQTARLNEMKPDTSGPIIGDDGREIDPSDHLPSETWAPEPERKNRKPEVILRFKHPSARDVAGARPRSSGTSGTSPGAEYPERGRQEYGGYGHGRNYSTTETARPRSSHRKSVSPAPSARSSHSVSSLYAPVNVGPPIPAKVPIAPPAGPSYPVMGGATGMDALSRELNSIDLGSVGCSVVRAPRKYVPKTITTGYAM
ncbi:ingression protein fic1 [Aspergillus udagawae]|uniref:Ingression protein fic1 n=1 Tax=Aspergillus udagawae TaxID=91492 RepID=A0ABQ1AAT1_9EURO|nr:ingression protein fic1 [Aspergillus udagawae]GFF75373.1 ingression protein fic1 [Aspergillus udagawae]GFG01608.1 ingression protein fic1 [Aspergillus udagawae]GFG21554.1 ingression protein fic1 [Aspergillus udagawae]